MTGFIEKTSIAGIASFRTADGSMIRELMHPEQHGNCSQSLAEATIAPGCITRLHLHRKSEELYHVVSGEGELTLGEKHILIKLGDTVCIHPGTLHQVKNTGASELKILCCCSPPYSHDDTELIDTDY